MTSKGKRLGDAKPEEIEALARELRNALRATLKALPPNERRTLDREMRTVRKLLARDPGHPIGKLAPAQLVDYFEARAAVLRVEGTKRSAEKRTHDKVDRNRRIHKLHDDGESQQVIAKLYRLSESQVSRILKKKPRP